MEKNKRGLSLAIICLLYLGFAGYLVDRHFGGSTHWRQNPLMEFPNLVIAPGITLQQRLGPRVTNRIVNRFQAIPQRLLQEQLDRIQGLLLRRLETTRAIQLNDLQWLRLLRKEIENGRRDR